MSELKAYKMVNEMYCTDVRVIPAEVYFKSEADKVIAELKSENERLKATPEEIMKEVFDKVLIYPYDMVRLEDAYKLAVALRSSRRTMWMARAERAKAMAKIYSQEANLILLREHYPNGCGFFYKMKNKWRKVEQLCRAKAEEFKEADQ